MAGISGFPEFLPGQQIAFNAVIADIKEIFHRYGFLPMDTPVVERLATLLSKGTDHEIYGLYRLGEEALQKELGLRFDLTVPLARYVAEHYGQLSFPYARYHIAPVWRGERPQSGRYRQFYQCDIDIVGQDILDTLYDAQILALIEHVLQKIGLQRFTIHVNHTKILKGVLLSFGVSCETLSSVMRVIDKVEKMAPALWEKALLDVGVSPAAVSFLTQLRTPSHTTPWPAHAMIEEGLSEMQAILDKAALFGLSDACVLFSPLLARGLTYYTGLMYEVSWHEAPQLGSICAGGRYDELASGFCTKKFPGVGVSFGISRIIPKLLEGRPLPQTVAPVLVTVQERRYLKECIAITQQLRQAQISTEIYLAERPLGAQMKYAAQRGFSTVVIAGEEEVAQGCVVLRSLQTGEQQKLSVKEAIAFLTQEKN